jgi:hypothetical protein
MREVRRITAAEVTPRVGQILGAQGVPADAETAPHHVALANDALARFAVLVDAVGLVQDVAADEFARIYHGEGGNDPHTPLADIFPRAGRLALFAVTVGAALTDAIAGLLEANDFAVATCLDAAASTGAELAAEALERVWRETLTDAGHAAAAWPIVRYSPGYCGWHVSGQRALFNALRPAQIGISLRESCLMEPLKSVSGVMVAGPAAIHAFKDDFPFCDGCEDRSCRERIRRVAAFKPKGS